MERNKEPPKRSAHDSDRATPVVIAEDYIPKVTQVS